MKRAACAVLSLLLWACEPASLPSPSIVSVVPNWVPQGEPSTLSVKVSAVLPLSVDYDSRSVDPAQLAMTVLVAGKQVDVPFAEADGTLVLPVPEGLPLGAYDIRVALADGREAVRERAFSVVSLPTLGGGPSDGVPERDEGPDDGIGGEVQGGLRGFQIDPIGEQIRDVPFQITVHAMGPGASAFREPVSLRASKGWVISVRPGAFSEGVRTQEIAISHPSPQVYLLIEDAHGHRGLSNPFRVRAH